MLKPDASKIKRTYSRNVVVPKGKSKNKLRIRKEFPKFEQLFLCKDESSDASPSPPKRVCKDLSNTDSWNNCKDAFDAIIESKPCNIFKEGKETGIYNETYKSTSSCSRTDTFMSAESSPSSFPEMFKASSKKKHKEEDSFQKTNWKVPSHTSPLIKKKQNKLTDQSTNYKVKLKNQVITSTPNVARVNRKVERSEDILHGEFSPVVKEGSYVFQTSDSDSGSPEVISKSALKNYERCYNLKESHVIIRDIFFNNSKKLGLGNAKTSGLSSDLYENSNIRTRSNASSRLYSFCQKITRRRVNGVIPQPSFKNLSESETSKENYSSIYALKGGKGWRRSLKKLSFSSQKSFRDSSISSSFLQTSSPNVCQDPRLYVLTLCKQTEEISFEVIFNKKLLSTCKKIGEGVYGEVFMSIGEVSKESVIKVMPIEGNFEVNGEPQKKFSEISAEIVVSKALSDLRNTTFQNYTSSFVEMHQCCCIQGSYSEELLNLWDKYAQEKGTENDRPDIFPPDQKFIILDFEYAGEDLEKFVFNNAMQAFSAFLQIAYALAVAETSLEFEHRDLHWGNVLISKTSESSILYRIENRDIKVKTNGVRAVVIDFTLSRLKVNEEIYFNDLSTDPSIFEGEGDYQFEIYRQMRNINGNDWKEFKPYTNIYWLHYIINKMMTECYYKNKSSKLHKAGIKKLRDIERVLLDHDSAAEFLASREDCEDTS